MKRFLLGGAAMLLASASVATIASAQSGPNANGYLLLHTDNAIQYTGDNAPYTGASGLQCEQDFPPCDYPDKVECELKKFDIEATSDQLDAHVVWWVLAVFPEENCPRLAGVTFGIGWTNEPDVIILDMGPSGDFELATGGWPGFFGEGTAVTWAAAQTSHITEVYWFGGYAYYAASVDVENIISITSHPTQGLNFADDAVPSNLDEIDGSRTGSLGLNGAEGFNPYGPSPTLESSWGEVKAIFGQETSR